MRVCTARRIGITTAITLLCSSPPGAMASVQSARGAHQRPPHAASGPTTLLQLKFKVGDVSRYRMAAQVEAHLPGTPSQPAAPVYAVSVDMVEQEQVTQVLPNGAGVLAITMVDGRGTLNGQTFTPPFNKDPAMITFDTAGSLLAVKAPPSEHASSQLLSGLFSSGALSLYGVYLPAHPVHLGDTWTKTVRIAGFTGSGVATVRCTFVKRDIVGHYKTAHIHSVMNAPLSTLIDASSQPTLQASAAIGSMHGTLVVTYDADLAVTEGKVVRTAGNGKVTVTIQSIAPRPVQRPVSTPGHAHTTPAAQTESQMVMSLQLGMDIMD